MSTNELLPYFRHSYADNTTITESHCVLCGALVAGGTADKYLAIAEAAHQCPMIEIQHQA